MERIISLPNGLTALRLLHRPFIVETSTLPICITPVVIECDGHLHLRCFHVIPLHCSLIGYLFLSQLSFNCICTQVHSAYIRFFLMNMEGFSKPPCHTNTMFHALLINMGWKQLVGGRR